MATRWGDGKLGAPPSLPRRLRLWEADHRCWVCASGMIGGQRDGGCDGSFHPGALVAKCVTQVLGWRGGDGEANDGWVWTGDHADALLAG